MLEFQRFVETPEWGAYQQAGHALMAYLILEKGITDRLFLLSSTERDLLLPDVQLLTIEDAGTGWAKTTFSLRSLTTVPIVLLAGYIATRKKYNLTDVEFSKHSKVVKLALGFCRGYVAEMCGDDYPPDFDQIVQDLFDKHWEFAEQVIEAHWHVIDALAEHLLAQKTMPTSEAFGLIEGYLAKIHREQ